eukprot:10003416-Karenia_brevis.AAC.1
MPSGSLTIPMTGMEVNVAKATGFVESPARFYAAMEQSTAVSPAGDAGGAAVDDSPAHVAETEPGGEVARRGNDTG